MEEIRVCVMRGNVVNADANPVILRIDDDYDGDKIRAPKLLVKDCGGRVREASAVFVQCARRLGRKHQANSSRPGHHRLVFVTKLFSESRRLVWMPFNGLW